jgi:lipid-binding SYLF domain-containing protein
MPFAIPLTTDAAPRIRRLGRIALAAACAIGAIALAEPRAAFATDRQEAQEVVDGATLTVQRARKDPEFGNAPELFKRAKAVMIVPQLVKGGFFFGGEGGQAVLVSRTAGGWSNPAFYTLASASFGLQIGIQSAEVVLFVMSEKALRHWMQDEFKLGAEAGLAVVTIGAGAEAAATTNLDADVIAWSKAQGAYAGITFEGSIIKPRTSYNEAYYGKSVTPEAIVSGKGAPAADAARLKAALATTK